MTVRVSPGKIGGILAVVVIALTCAHLAGQFSKYVLDHDRVFGLVAMFDLDNEGNIPAWFASTALFSASVLLAVIACLKRNAKDSYTWHWFGLAFVFLLMAVDESVRLHEGLSGRISSVVSTRGVFYFAWTIPAAIGVLMFGLAYLRFLLHLPRVSRYLFLISGAVFVGGALGMEMIEGQFVTLLGENNLAHACMVALEEFLEMSGVVLFIYALLGYLKTEYGSVQIQLGRDSGGA